jgi:C4-dicarboxylate transporter/malic acid transport protein
MPVAGRFVSAAPRGDTHLMSPRTTDPLPARRGLFRELEHPRLIVSNLTPNWFGSIMGTGIVATAAATLPVEIPGLRIVATVVWALASLLLVALTVATVLHWTGYRETARSHLPHPVMANFYGAPPMALLTVGAGTILLGRDVLGLPLAVGIDEVLWALGTALGLVTAVAIPYLTFLRDDVRSDSAFGGWLMPIVPPMVSASTGALLLPYLPAGQARLTMLWGCYALFGMSLVASFIVITLIWLRLAQHSVGPAALVPTLWIVLGPLGLSISAANLLGAHATLVVDPRTAHALLLFGELFGVPVLGFTLLWTALACLLTLRTVREHLPFSLTWWSFTFAIGTSTTGISELALHTGLVALQVLAVVFYVGLVAAWLTVGIRTFAGSVLRGTLLAPPAAV